MSRARAHGENRSSIPQLRDDAVDRVMRAERRMQATAEAVDEFAVRARDFNASLARRIITREIEPGLGIVAVTGSGDLVDVRFNVDGIRTADPARLGERLLRAMNIAEEKIRGIRERGLENISKTTIGEWE